ncbi:MAG: nicotinamide riboside transporter PnuC [Gemmatimonadales bacterium]
MRIVESVAVLFGIVAVWFNARQNVLGWVTGLVNVLLFTFIFYQSRLYALMALQVVFAAISLYGWYQWLRGGEDRGGRSVTRTPVPIGLALAAGVIAAAAGLGWALARFTPDQQPYLDAGISVVAMAAQWMMARKYYETWWIWIAVNLVAVPFFLLQSAWPTALQYTVYLVLAIGGLRQWRRSLDGA